MKLLVFILNKEEQLGDVLTAFVEVGINEATIIDSVGMGRVLAYDVPLFAELRYMMKEVRPYNKTIIALVEDDRIIEDLVRVVEEICGPLSKPGSGILFTLPVDFAYGFKKGRE
ncbi:MAG TPA: hypothetical protein ENJ81_01980 [Candidatus Aerophobetes bacterium]|nr:hypothetical protein [Candidatus Aerophobetes bacterium]